LPKLFLGGMDNRVKQLSILGFFNEFGRNLVSVYLPLYLFATLQAPYELVGLALTITSGTSAFFQIVGGIVADSWGRKRAMLLSSGIKIPILAILAIGSQMGISIMTFVVLYVATEALSGIYLTSSHAMIADVTEKHRRTEAYGIYRIGVNLGFTLGAFVGGFIAAFSILFAIWLLCVSVAAGTILFFVAESHRPTGEKFRPLTVFGAVRDRALLEFGLVSLVAGLVANQMGATFALYTTSHLSITREQLGALYSLNGAMIIALQYPLARLVLRYRLSKLLAIASAFRAFGFLLISIASDFYLLQVVIVALTLGEMIQAPSASSYAASIAPEKKRGEYLGFHNWAWNSGQALSAVVGGCLLGLLMPAGYVTWYIVFVIGMTCTFFYVHIAKKARRMIPRLDDML